MTTASNRIEQVSKVAFNILAAAQQYKLSDGEALTKHLLDYNLDSEQLEKTLAIIHEVPSGLNRTELIKRLLNCKTNKALMLLNDFYTAYVDGEIEEILEHIGLEAIELLELHSVDYAAPDSWREVADADLRENGMDSNALYWLDEIDTSETWQVLNTYENGFNNFDSMHDMLMHYCDTTILEALDNTIKDANGELFTVINEPMQLVLKDAKGDTLKSFMHFGAYPIDFSTKELTSVEAFDKLVDTIIGGNK